VNFQGALKERGVKQGLDLFTLIKTDTSVLSQLFCPSCIDLMKSLKQRVIYDGLSRLFWY
jgi:hypothetical protein